VTVPAFDALGPYLACEVHGRLVHRDLADVPAGAPSCVWVCVGFDGEADGWCTAGPVPCAARLRLLAGEKYWPGVAVMTGDGEVTGPRPAESAAVAEVRQLVNRILRAGPA
jgi:hypothetical protein